MDHLRWCNIHNVNPCYHSVIANIDTHYVQIRFQQFVILSSFSLYKSVLQI